MDTASDTTYVVDTDAVGCNAELNRTSDSAGNNWEVEGVGSSGGSVLPTVELNADAGVEANSSDEVDSSGCDGVDSVVELDSATSADVKREVVLSARMAVNAEMVGERRSTEVGCRDSVGSEMEMESKMETESKSRDTVVDGTDKNGVVSSVTGAEVLSITDCRGEVEDGTKGEGVPGVITLLRAGA